MVVNVEGLVLDVSVSNSRESMWMWFRGSIIDKILRRSYDGI